MQLQPSISGEQRGIKTGVCSILFASFSAHFSRDKVNVAANLCDTTHSVWVKET